MGYAFISYSTKNQTFADSMRNLLNSNGIKTWMAPGDIPAGSKYAGVINRAVKDCSCFILLLSNDSQESFWVGRETERAISYHKTIFPIQIEDVIINDEFELYVSTEQIIAIRTIDESSEEIQKLLRCIEELTGTQSLHDATDVSKQNAQTIKEPVEEPIAAKTNKEVVRRKNKNEVKTVLCIVFSIVIVVTVLMAAFFGRGDGFFSKGGNITTTGEASTGDDTIDDDFTDEDITDDDTDTYMTCPDCGGTGWEDRLEGDTIVEEPCLFCDGTGKVKAY